MRLGRLAIVSLLGCGGPVLHNAPRANPAVVAAGAAAIAGAATLADPDAAARRQEQKREADVPRPPPDGESPRMPSDVLDRLDQAEAARKSEADGARAAPASAPAPAPGPGQPAAAGGPSSPAGPRPVHPAR